MEINTNNGGHIIDVDNLTRIYNVAGGDGNYVSQELYINMDLQVEPGEFVAIVGPSGCGKTTLLNIIGGLDSIGTRGKLRVMDEKSKEEKYIPTLEGDGRVLVEQQSISQLQGDARSAFINQKIGFIFQFHHLIPELTALQNVALPMKIGGCSSRKADDWARKLLKEVGLGDHGDKRPAVLSGGEKQRVAIARALANDPVILLADEPTGSLNQELKEGIMDTFCRLNRERGVTVLMVTHDRNILFDRQGRLKIHRFIRLPITKEPGQGKVGKILPGSMETLPCPRCGIKNTFIPVQRKGKPGYECRLCLGVWFDYFEPGSPVKGVASSNLIRPDSGNDQKKEYCREA